LAITYYGRLTIGIGMELNHPFQKRGLSVGDVADRLSRHWLGQKADEVTGMSRLKGDADLALRLKPTNTGAVTGARIDHDERPLTIVDFNAGRGG
jgi:hypothetical protein